jgi:hypothetical protein
MSQRRQMTTCLAALVACVAAARCVSAQGGILTAPRVLNLPAAPFELSALPERSSTPPGMENLAGVEFSVTNTGRATLTKIAVQAAVFTATGDPRGYFSFEMPLALKPGRSTYAVHATADFKVDATDHLVLLPLYAEGFTLRWRLPEGQLRALGRALVTARGEASAVPLGEALQNLSGAIVPQQQYPPDTGTGGGCTACSNAPTTCKEFCSPCFPGGYSCSCQPFNVSCTCGACPKTPGS